MKKRITNFALNLDSNTKLQFDSCCSENFVKLASLMPDAHSGYVAPIGSVLITKDVVVPTWVGYDIGCGMIALKFDGDNLVNLVRKNSKLIFDSVKNVVPMGIGKVNHIKNVSLKSKSEFNILFSKFKLGKYDQSIYRIIKNKSISNLGSLGQGNHFIELGVTEDELWLVIHSGSRNIGHSVATKYMKKAFELYNIKNFKKNLELSNIDDKNFEKTATLDVNSIEGEKYLNVLDFALDFALLNRLEIAYKVRDSIRNILNLPELDFELWTNKNHNHCVYEESLGYIHRKGATPARLGERGVIPANMRDGCFLVEGLGNADFLFSSSHGAGRVLSRTDAKNKIKLSDFEKSMKGIVGEVSIDFIDEAPDAYKNIYNVMDAQKNSVKVLKHIKPIINWKG